MRTVLMIPVNMSKIANICLCKRYEERLERSQPKILLVNLRMRA